MYAYGIECCVSGIKVRCQYVVCPVAGKGHAKLFILMNHNNKLMDQNNNLMHQIDNLIHQNKIFVCPFPATVYVCHFK